MDDIEKVYRNKATKSFNLLNIQLFRLVLSPFDYNATTFADHYDTARTNFDLSKRKWDTLNIHQVDVEIFLNTWNASPNLPKARLMERHGCDQLNIEWLTYGNVELREHWRSNNIRYKDACYLVLAKLNVDVALPNSSNEGNTEVKYRVYSESDIKDQVQYVNFAPNEKCLNDRGYLSTVLNLQIRQVGQLVGPRWAWLMVVPNKCFFCQYAYDKEQKRHTELPLHWLKINRHLHGEEGFNSAAGFVNTFDKNII